MVDFTINHIAHGIVADLKPAMDDYFKDATNGFAKIRLEQALWENKVGILRLAEKFAINPDT